VPHLSVNPDRVGTDTASTFTDSQMEKFPSMDIKTTNLNAGSRQQTDVSIWSSSFIGDQSARRGSKLGLQWGYPIESQGAESQMEIQDDASQNIMEPAESQNTHEKRILGAMLQPFQKDDQTTATQPLNLIDPPTTATPTSRESKRRGQCGSTSMEMPSTRKRRL
jgi:hypothetical protein